MARLDTTVVFPDATATESLPKDSEITHFTADFDSEPKTAEKRESEDN